MKKYFLPLAGLVIVSIGLIATLSQTQTRQEIRKLAFSPGGAGKIILSPQAISKYIGEQFSVTINIQTGTSPTSGIALRLTYPYTDTTPEFDVVDQNGNSSNQIYPSQALLGTGDWSFPVKTVSRSNGLVTIDFAAINQSFTGFTSVTSVPLATIYFKTNRATSGAVALSFDPSVTKMLSKVDATDILDTPINGSINIQVDNLGPNKISDLNITNRTQSSVTLAWTAPADVPSGNASTYEVRYSTNPITDASWTSAPLAISPIPKAAGQAESLTVNGLSADTAYYFALKSKDSLGNVSQLSNVASGATLPSTLSFGNFGFKLQAFNKPAVTKSVTLTFKNSSMTKTYTLNTTSDSTGLFKPVAPIDLSGLTISAAGSVFDVFLKEPTYLQKKLGSLALTQGANMLPTSPGLVLKAGDFDNNNELNIDDITAILVKYISLSIPVNSAIAVFDIDGNNFLDIDDITNVLINYTALVVSGDK